MPTLIADRAVKHVNKPLHITKRIGSTTYKVSVHFSRTSRETMSDKLVRLIERDAVKQ
nr:transposon-encoded TnpW family protein [uncultured Oscillibacter sp.]